MPPLLAMIDGATPMLRIKLLEIIRQLYMDTPRPKEFIATFKIRDVLKKLLDEQGREAEAVHAWCHQLLTAFQINVLL